MVIQIKTGEGQESTDNYQLSIASCPLKEIALFPGTFDPFTIGHESLVSRGLELVDEIIISIGINDTKRTYFSLEKRLKAIQELYKDEPRVRVMSYDSLTVDFAQQMNAGFILRGIRTVNDFEYEKSIADVNRKLSGIETFILFTEPEHTHISSSIVRELLRYGKDISQFVPKGTNPLLKNKKQETNFTSTPYIECICRLDVGTAR